MRMKRILTKSLAVGVSVVIGYSSIAFGSSSRAEAATPESLKLLDTGKELVGTPYLFGAPSGVTYAFDCSSFTQFVFKKLDVSLPRTSIAQAEMGTKVAKGYLSVGDLLFFNTSGSGISHVGIYAGNNKMLHSSKSGVKISDITSAYWNKRYVTARRVL
jgi:cell wall-associated NlpC family hydrolase